MDFGVFSLTVILNQRKTKVQQVGYQSPSLEMMVSSIQLLCSQFIAEKHLDLNKCEQ